MTTEAAHSIDMDCASVVVSIVWPALRADETS